MSIYNFRIPSFHINEIRSAHDDTLFAATSLQVLNPNGSLLHDFGTKNATLGDRKAGGGVDLNLSWENIFVPDPSPENPDGGAIAWSFLLVNSGHPDPGFAAALNNAANALAGALVGRALELKGLVGPALLSAAAIGVIVLEALIDLLRADCDGPVGAGGFHNTAAELAAMTAIPGFIFNTTQNNPGSDSPVGCGANSNYDINYRIARLPQALVTLAPGSPLTSWLVPDTGDEHVVGLGPDGTVHEFFFTRAAGHWQHGVIQNAGVVAPGSPLTSWLVPDTGDEHVVGLGPDGTVHEFFFTRAAGHWQHGNISQDAA
jgi:hypothetical protein